MIKKIFLPERIGSYYLFGKRTVGIDIGLHEIYATTVLAKGNSRTIEKLNKEQLSTETGLSYDELVIDALKALKLKIGAYDELCCVIPSSLAIFKKLTLPFTGLKKIKMVVPFEVESLLPFTLDQAELDCIITHEDTEKQLTEILVGAVKRDIIERYTHYFAAAGIPLNRLSIDMFELYGLYKLVEEKADAKGTLALIDIGYSATRLALIVDGRLKHIRTLPQGIVAVAKTLSALNEVDTSENIQKLLLSGIDETLNTSFGKMAQKAFDALADEIAFTLTTYLTRMHTDGQPGPEKVLLLGMVADVPGIAEYMTKKLQTTVQLLRPKKLIHNAIITSKITTLSNSFMGSIAAAISNDTTVEFNLQKEEAQKEEDRIINSQLWAGALLTVFIFLSFGVYSFFRVRNLRLSYKKAEIEAIKEIQKNFKLKASQTVDLSAANKAASSDLRRQETTWHRLSSENRYAFLRYLTELSKCINLKKTQLDLASLVMGDDTIKLYGSVPGYKELTILQSQLECPLFKKLPKLQDWNFKSEPIVLTINKEEL